MRSNFTPVNRGTRRGGTGTTPHVDETYDLRGLNQIAPDQVMPKGESPKAQNARMYAREETESRVAIRTRKGSRRLSTPVGEALNTQNIAGGTGDATFTATSWILIPFTPSVTGALTRLDFEIKNMGTGFGHVIVEIFNDVAGSPGTTLLGQGSILNSAITTAYQYLPSYYIDAPSVTNGTQYWARCRVAELGTATYGITKTAASGGKSTVDPGTVFTNLGYTWRFKSYISTTGVIKGYMKRYPSNNVNRTMMAFGTNVYAITDAGVPTSISSAIDANATKVRFDQVDDKTFWCDGINSAKWWDGTTVSVIANVPGIPSHIKIHQNRAFWVPVSDPNRVNFSDLFSFESYTSTNFFYAPNPKSPDHITALEVFQDNLLVFTHETKHIVYGSDISNFTRKEAVGTKGAVSQEAVAVDRNYAYFMADDKMIYRYNGIDDELISERVEPLLQDISDVSKVRLHVYRNQLRVYFPSGTDSQSEDMLLCELSDRESNKHLQWFHDTGRPVTGSIEWVQDDNQLIEFSSKVGAFYLGETDESDLGKAIDFAYWTAYQAYGSGSAKDRVSRFRPFIRPTDAPFNMTVGKDIDFNNDPQNTTLLVDPGGSTWGEFVWGDGTIWGDNTQLINQRIPMSGRGNFTQYRFECNKVESPVELYGYMSLLKVGKIK